MNYKHTLARLLLSVLSLSFSSNVFSNEPPSVDNRIALKLTSSEKADFLQEMRQMLKSIQGIVSGIGEKDREKITKSAKYSGNRMARSTPASVKKKLPQSFKELGGPTHQLFEELAVIAETDDMETLNQLTGKLMNQCLACHETFKVTEVNGSNANTDVPLKVTKVADNIYALEGELNQRSKDNYANNATFGLVVTSKGALLIDSGGSYLGGKQIAETIKSITDQPVKIVINTGGQDHRWFGNSYFKAKGAHIISSKAAYDDQKKRASEEYNGVEKFLGDKIKGTKEVYADETFENELSLTLGEYSFKIIHAGTAHTVGDSFVWMPKEKILFSGDIVFMDRLLGPGPGADTASWMKVFETMASYHPKVIIPGHGAPGSLKKASDETYNYIKFMRTQVAKILDNDGSMLDAKTIDQSQYSYLKVYKKMAGRSAQAFYSQMEFE